MLELQKIYKEILNSLDNLTMSNFSKMSTAPKRSVDQVDEPTSPSIVKKRKPMIAEEGPVSIIKHFLVDKANWDVSVEQIKSLFKSIRIMVLDSDVDKNNNVIPHYHILGEAKVSQRKMRDWSLNNIRAADIKGGLEAKGFYLTASIKNIENLKHFNNTVEYLKRKNNTIFEDENVVFGTMANPLWRILDEAEEPAKYNQQDMLEFKRRFPIVNSWHSTVAKQKLSKWSVKVLEEMEAQRKHEERIRNLSDEEKHLLLPNLPILLHA